MARNHANNGRIYRAVIVMNYADGRQFTITRGPYDTPTPAKAQINAAVKRGERSQRLPNAAWGAHTAEGHVESAEVVWMREAR